MSVLQMMACDGCGAHAETDLDYSDKQRVPDDWLEVEGPATPAEITELRLKAVKRHACSPACLVVVAKTLAAMPGALDPVK